MRLKQIVLVQDSDGVEAVYVDGVHLAHGIDGGTVYGAALRAALGVGACQVTSITLDVPVCWWPDQFDPAWNKQIHPRPALSRARLMWATQTRPTRAGRGFYNHFQEVADMVDPVAGSFGRHVGERRKPAHRAHVQLVLDVQVDWPEGVPFDRDEAEDVAACVWSQSVERDVGVSGKIVWAKCYAEQIKSTCYQVDDLSTQGDKT